jgi:Skp family chaperone for outer membrane proteins
MRALSFLAVLFAACLMLSATPARAGMIGTTQLLAPSADTQRASVDAFLVREDVQRELQAHGVSPADAASRVASLTDAELQMLSSRIDSLPAGAGVSTLELLLIIIIIILLI